MLLAYPQMLPPNLFLGGLLFILTKGGFYFEAPPFGGVPGRFCLGLSLPSLRGLDGTLAIPLTTESRGQTRESLSSMSSSIK